MNHKSKQIFDGFVGRFRHAKWLHARGFGPDVFLFRNLESGQVLYTQLPFTQAYNIKKQFQNPNWQNRLPDPRRDIWRPMAVAQLPNYELAVECYESLVTLRHYRDKVHKDLANSWRKRNEDGNIWYSSQYRPTYTQEAVADLATVLEAFEGPATVHWESQWRRGDDKHWSSLITHEELPKYNPRDSSAVLRELGFQHYKEFEDARIEANRQQQRAQQIESVASETAQQQQSTV